MFMVRKNKRTEKNWRYIFYSGFITALILCLFYVAPDRAFAEETKILKTQDYVYQYNKKYKGIEILSYEGKEVYVKAPERIDNLPVTVIGKDAFRVNTDIFPNSANKNIKEIILPETVSVIKENAFRDCEGLEKINLPKNLFTLEAGAFASCVNLKEITLPENLKIISEELFAGCKNLKHFQIPKNIVKIQNNAFCSAGIEEVTFEEGSRLESIGGSAFKSCHNLSELWIPNSIKEIENRAFRDCAQLKKVTFEEGSKLEIIDFETFGFCDNLSELWIPDSIKELEGRA